MSVASLILEAHSASNNIRLNLSNYLNVQQGEGMDPYNPSFTNKVFSHSLLKEGGTYALESLALKELQFPLRLKASTAAGVQELVQQLNQVLNSPGAVCIWQDTSTSQATYFDIASGQFDIQYNFREAEAAAHSSAFVKGMLRVFVQPLGRRASPRPYAAASGVGPLLMISPYASGGALTVAASTQAGVEGYGGKQQPSGGIFYQGNPSLAGDAGSLLQISYAAPLPNTASNTGVVPYTAVSLLPDQNYQPLITAGEIEALALITHLHSEAPAVASGYWSLGASVIGGVFFNYATASRPPCPRRHRRPHGLACTDSSLWLEPRRGRRG